MKKVAVENAVGQVLCHDMTRIVRGVMKGPQFRKGQIVREEDIPMLLSMGKKHIYIWEKHEGILHENEAAEALAALCRDGNMEQSPPSEGKITLTALYDGLFQVDTERLNRINAIDDIIIATRHSLSPVKKGDKLAAMKVVPVVIPEEKLKQAEKLADAKPLLSLMPYRLKNAAVITTGSEVAEGLVTDTFTPVIAAKLASCGITIKKHIITGDDAGNVRAAIRKARGENPDVILCTGGMSVDPDDNTPGAIRQSGAEIVSYGAPVMPGAMFLLGYFEDGIPIMGLPGCVMYAAVTVFDLVLPRIAAGLRMTRRDFTCMGNGGLCLSCEVCHYPVCPFGKAS